MQSNYNCPFDKNSSSGECQSDSIIQRASKGIESKRSESSRDRGNQRMGGRENFQ